MYPKVKVRQELGREEDDGFASDLGGLQAFDSLSLDDCSSPMTVKTDFSAPSSVKEPKCYVPRVYAPRVPVTEDDGDCSFASNSPSYTGREKDDHISKNRLNTRANLIPRPRAVVSSPDNDVLYRNRTRDVRLFASKNRHLQCGKVKSSDATDIPTDRRKSKEPGSNDKTVPAEKKRVNKGSIKSESVPRAWRF